MASSTAVWYAVSTDERQGAAVSIASLNFPLPAYAKKVGVSGSFHWTAQDSCASYFDLLMQLLPLPRHSSSSVGCRTDNMLQSHSPSQPQRMADHRESLWIDDDTDLTYVPTYTNSSSIQQSLPLCTPQSSDMESPWVDDDTHLTYVPSYTNSSSTLQSLPCGTPKSRQPAAVVCPSAPMRPRPSVILVPAEELHMCSCFE